MLPNTPLKGKMFSHPSSTGKNSLPCHRVIQSPSHYLLPAQDFGTLSHTCNNPKTGLTIYISCGKKWRPVSSQCCNQIAQPPHLQVDQNIKKGDNINNVSRSHLSNSSQLRLSLQNTQRKLTFQFVWSFCSWVNIFLFEPSLGWDTKGLKDVLCTLNIYSFFTWTIILCCLKHKP